MQGAQAYVSNRQSCKIQPVREALSKCHRIRRSRGIPDILRHKNNGQQMVFSGCEVLGWHQNYATCLVRTSHNRIARIGYSD